MFSPWLREWENQGHRLLHWSRHWCDISCHCSRCSWLGSKQGFRRSWVQLMPQMHSNLHEHGKAAWGKHTQDFGRSRPNSHAGAAPASHAGGSSSPAIACNYKQSESSKGTTHHKISADKVIQLSSKGDFKKVHPNAGKTLSNKRAQLWVWNTNTTEQLCHSCYRKRSDSAGYHPPSTISLLIHCPQNWKFGPFSLSDPFPRGLHPDGAVSCLPLHTELPRPGTCEAASSGSCRAASKQPTASTGRAGAKGVFAQSQLMANTRRPVRALFHRYHGLGATKEGREEK